MKKNSHFNTSIVTESDVEQRDVYPILTENPPDGLGFYKTDILTKHNVRKILINKGSNKKNHYPDYLLQINGVPLVVIEVKKPGGDLEEAFREARLYANEINSYYLSGLNPLNKIVATDGQRWIVGTWDSDIKISDFKDTSPHCEGFSHFVKLFKKNSLLKEANEFNKKIFPEKYFQPIKFVGGEKTQNEEIGYNSFGEQLISEYRHIFNPNSVEDRKYIARYGYISPHKNRRSNDSINKIINSDNFFTIEQSNYLNDQTNPIEIVTELRKKRELENKIILLIGNVGAGKTTFIDYLIETFIPDDVKSNTLWIRLNMNHSPVNRDEIYNWLKTQIIKECESSYPDMDFTDLSIIEKIYSVEINKFNKGIGKLLANESERNKEKYQIIKDYQEDLNKKTLCYTRHLGSERGKLIIIVLDNCDKRSRDEQLLMFEVAQWLQKEFNVLIFLPLRDETYDNHRNEPPLDTAIKDLVFRIEPPMFQDVLLSRVQLILNKMTKKSNQKIKYKLPNGYSVDCGKDEKSYYLTSIVRSIFVFDKQIRRIIVGLAGKNIRRALEIFMEFCTSGHITEDEILKIRQNDGRYSLPLHIVTRILLRMKRRFYSSEYSYLKNLFSISKDDKNPNYFTKYIILKWYRQKHSCVGTSGYKGYFSIRELKEDIIKYGISEDIIIREINYLIKGFCLESEKFTNDIVDEGDLLKITSTGFVHLEMISNINYLAAIAEDTNFDDINISIKIAKSMGENSTQYNKEVVAENAKVLIEYIEGWQKKYYSLSSNYLDDNDFTILSNIEEAKNCVDKFTQSIKDPHWLEFKSSHNIGDTIVGIINNVNERYGIFVTLFEKNNSNVSGLIYRNRCPQDYIKKYKVNDKISVRIEDDIDIIKKRVSLSIVEDISN